MAAVKAIESEDAFKKLASDTPGALMAVHFWTSWAPQCEQINAVLDELYKIYPAVKFAKVEAEQVAELSEKFSITAVPTVILIKNGKEIDRINGANVPELTEKDGIRAKSGVKELLIALPHVELTHVKDLETKLKKLIHAAPVMLFMKGTADEPRCGFSRTTVDLLKSVDAEFSTFNILADDEVRQGLKKFSNWPTYPQLYINGDLVGGLDIIKELAASGDLKEMLPKAKSEDELNTKLKALINRSDVMLFMKGIPESPRCGFSRTIVGILQETGVEFDHYDILGDNEVREGLKKFSNWPTYPQLYAKGELVGGLDIVKELKEAGELISTLRGE